MKWDTVCFGNLYEEDSKNGLTKPSKVRGSGYKMINMGELFANDRIYDVPMELVPLKDKEKKNAKIECGDLLFARQSLVLEGAGKCSIVMDVSPLTVFESHIIRVRLKKTVANPLFYYYYFKSPYSEVKTIVSQCAQAGIRGSDLRKLNVIHPSLDVQNRIAVMLSSYDDLIENNYKQIKLLEEVAQRLYKEWFVDFRFPGHETAKFINGLPEGWRKDTINSQIHLLSGYAFKSSVFNKFGKYKIITIKNVKDGQFDDSNVNHLDAPPDNMPKHCHLKDGDILLSLTGNVGRVCIVVGDGFLMNQRVAKIESTIPAYAYFLFRSDRLFNEINSLANGVAQQNLSPVRTGKIKVCYPSDDILQRFEKIVEPIINRTIALSKKNSILTEARDRLLPKLINGEIEV